MISPVQKVKHCMMKVIKHRRAIIMARVSSDEQAKGYSLEIQEESIRKWCELNNIEIAKIFREDHSAKDFNRPQWKELKAYAKTNQSKMDMLLVTTWDRFSRNTTDAFNELFSFKKLGIEVQAIQQPIDFSIPESKVLLAIYLTLPEVDNDRRSMKIREGIRAALQSGRWSRKAPIGYINTRDASNKPHIIPGEESFLIKYAFEEIAKGASQAKVLKTINSKGLRVSRNNISLLLRNLVYIGKIRVPHYEDQPEEIIDGLHEPVVDVKLFYKVQEVLNQSVSKLNKPLQNSTRNELPLRGILSCSCCGNKVTGSASRSKTGARHFYYHCNFCKKERYKASLPYECIESFFSGLTFSESAKAIYKDMLETLNMEKHGQKKAVDVQATKVKIGAVTKRIEKLQDLLIDEVSTVGEYNNKKAVFDNQLQELNGMLITDKPKQIDRETKLQKGIATIINVNEIYKKGSVIEKQRLISSIFPEKIEFSNNKCRTLRVNDLLFYMLLKDSNLSEIKKGQFDQKIELSRQVESPGIEPGSKQAIKQLSTRLFPN